MQMHSEEKLNVSEDMTLYFSQWNLKIRWVFILKHITQFNWFLIHFKTWYRYKHNRKQWSESESEYEHESEYESEFDAQKKFNVAKRKWIQIKLLSNDQFQSTIRIKII